MSTSEILFRRRRAVAFNAPTVPADRATFVALSSLQHELERLGFTLDEPALLTALNSPATVIEGWASELVAIVRKSLGAHVSYAPMYPNFPRQVEEASDGELWLNAVLHYFGDTVGERIMPVYVKHGRVAHINTRPLTVLTFAEDEIAVLGEIAQQLALQSATWSETDVADIAALTAEGLVFDNFKNRANFATFVASTDDVATLTGARSVTDVLRVALALGGQSPEFVKGGRFASIPRRWRKALVSTLDTLAADGSGVDVVRRRVGLWKVLGERLHVSEFREVAPHAAVLFDSIRSGDAPRSLRSAIQAGTPGADLDSLRSQSPSEFARDLDWALRTSDNPERTLDAFRSVADKVPTRILWQALNALRNRDAGIRAFLPKGNAARVQFSTEPLAPLAASVVSTAEMFLYEAIVTQYAKLPALGDVTVDPALRNYAVPFQVRTAGTAFRPLGRGSRIPIGDSKFIRFFMWWKDLDTSDSYRNRVDLDMSLSFMDEDFAVTGEVAFYNLTNGAATHSGDITSAPNGAAEFVDIRSEALAADNGARYVAMSVTSYTAQPFNTLTDALAGVMLRNDSGHGEVFEGTSVETAFSLTQDAVSVVPFIYDIEKRELIWLDQAVSTRGAFYYAGAARGRFAQMTEAVVRRAPVTVYEVLSAHAEARGTEGAAPATLGEDIAFSPETLLSDWL